MSSSSDINRPRVLNQEILRRIVDLIITQASSKRINYREELRKYLPASLQELGTRVFENIAETIIARERIGENKYVYRCSLCGRSFSSSRGVYIHLKKNHFTDLIDLLDSELNRSIENSS